MTETYVSAGLLGLVLGVMAVGAVARNAGRPLVWGDELAVLLMAASVFFAASACLSDAAPFGRHIAVDLMTERYPALRHVVDAVLLVLVAGFGLCLWRWLDPVGLWRAGGGAELGRETFNFTWTEPTMSLGLRKVWFWLSMVPATLGAMFHLAVRLRFGGHTTC